VGHRNDKNVHQTKTCVVSIDNEGTKTTSWSPHSKSLKKLLQLTIQSDEIQDIYQNCPDIPLKVTNGLL
jgi:hypothetical protein